MALQKNTRTASSGRRLRQEKSSIRWRAFSKTHLCNLPRHVSIRWRPGNKSLWPCASPLSLHVSVSIQIAKKSRSPKN